MTAGSVLDVLSHADSTAACESLGKETGVELNGGFAVLRCVQMVTTTCSRGVPARESDVDLSPFPIKTAPQICLADIDCSGGLSTFGG